MPHSTTIRTVLGHEVPGVSSAQVEKVSKRQRGSFMARNTGDNNDRTSDVSGQLLHGDAPVGWTRFSTHNGAFVLWLPEYPIWATSKEVRPYTTLDGIAQGRWCHLKSQHIVFWYDSIHETGWETDIVYTDTEAVQWQDLCSAEYADSLEERMMEDLL